ncbi:MAG: hypothetical protein J6Z13_05110 [Clostridia bacterium]|nr:hypothetical protein [Clostridia bacterium]
MKKSSVIGAIVFVGLLLFCAFSQGGFLAGMKVLGEIVNIFGTAFVFLLKAIFSIPELAQELTKRILTTLLVWTFYGFGLYGTDKNEKIIWGVMGAIASAAVTFLTWVGMF